jgi:hypothetical protein
MRNKSAETGDFRQRVSALSRLVMTVLLVLAFCSLAAAQLEPIRERGVHTLYGDIKVEAEPGTESQSRLASKSSSTSSMERSSELRLSPLTDGIASWSYGMASMT